MEHDSSMNGHKKKTQHYECIYPFIILVSHVDMDVSHHRINRIHERVLRILYKVYHQCTFEELLERGNSFN